MVPHSTLDDRHQQVIIKMTEKNFSEIKTALKKGDGAAKIKLHEIIETALSHGINFALDAENAAWQRTTELEDVLISICAHAPESDLLRRPNFNARSRKMNAHVICFYEYQVAAWKKNSTLMKNLGRDNASIFDLKLAIGYAENLIFEVRNLA